MPTPPFVIPWDQQQDSLAYHYWVVRLWEIPQQRVLETTEPVEKRVLIAVRKSILFAR